MKRFRVALLALLLLGMLVVTTGCKITGGGWIPSATGEGKANIAYNVEIADEEPNEFVKGNLVYHDMAAGVRVKCEVEGTCNGVAVGDEFEPIGALLTGTYTPQGKYEPGDEGTFAIWVADYHGSGPESGDWTEISLDGGKYDGYYNGGVLEGGNFTYHVTADE